jgi:hypothetical protein
MYLKNFATEQGMLHGYTKRTNRIIPLAKPRDIAAEMDFHTDLDEETQAKLESKLAHNFEGPLSRTICLALSRIRSNTVDSSSRQIISQQEKLDLAKFAALQLVRTKKIRDEMFDQAKNYRTPLMTLSDIELARAAHIMLINRHIDDNFNWFGQAIARHRICFQIAPQGQYFWTNDNPVFLGRGTDDGKAFWKGVGLKDDRLELYLPLSSDITAVFVGKHIRKVPPTVNLNAAQVVERNRLTYLAAHELVVGAVPISPVPI